MGNSQRSKGVSRLRGAAAAAAVAAVQVAVKTLKPTEKPGQTAEPEPLEPFSWGRVFKAFRSRIKEENVPFLAAGLAYYGMLAMVPGLIAVVSLFGLVADPADAASLVNNLGDAVPADVRAFIDGQLTSIVETSNSSLGVSLTISVLGALWAASNGTKALIRGVNLAYGIDETRGLLKLRLLSLALTLGLIAAVSGLLAVVTVGHRWLGRNRWFDPILEYGRWPVVLGAVIIGIAGLYRWAPSRKAPSWSLASLGAVGAACAWVVASFGLSIYVSRFGSFNETYGTLGAVIVVLIWLFVSGFIVLLGAVFDSVLAETRAHSA